MNEVPLNDAPSDRALPSDASAEHGPVPVAADAATEKSAAPPDPIPQAVVHRRTFAPLIALAAILAWLVPGLGHLLIGRWGRALAFFVSVCGLAITGYWLRGNVFPQHSNDPFGTLGFLADASTGVLYYFSRFFEAAGSDVSRAAGDYGTRFIAAAGVVNALAVFDILGIAFGRRS